MDNIINKTDSVFNLKINGVALDNPLLGEVLFHPTIGESLGNSLGISTITNDISKLDELLKGGRTHRVFILINFTNYQGEGKYALENLGNEDENDFYYARMYYNEEKQELDTEEEFDIENSTENESYIEITQDKNGKIKGSFVAYVISYNATNKLKIEGTFDLNYD